MSRRRKTRLLLRLVLLGLTVAFGAARYRSQTTPTSEVPAAQPALTAPPPAPPVPQPAAAVPQPAVTVPQPAMTASPGFSAGGDATPDQPGRRIYVAQRPGTLPQTGRPIIAGVRLPFGRRAGGIPLWATSRPTPKAVELAARLASAFPRTGLWPVLWSFPDNPASYMDGPDGYGRISTINVQRSLRGLWQRYSHQGQPFVGPFYGLARGSRQRRFRNPFSILASQEQQLDANDKGPYRLMLIPCRRPADSVAAVGLELSGLIGDGLISAVLRSWENRFGATVVGFGAGRLVLAVNAPPHGAANASRLARELFALSPPTSVTPDSLRLLSEAFAAGSSGGTLDFDPPMRVTSGTWGFGFDD